MNSEHESETIVEREIKSTVITAGENYTKCGMSDTLIQVNQCPDCENETNIVVCSEIRDDEFVTVEIPAEALSYVLGEYRRQVNE